MSFSAVAPLVFLFCSALVLNMFQLFCTVTFNILEPSGFIGAVLFQFRFRLQSKTCLIYTSTLALLPYALQWYNHQSIRANLMSCE